MLKFIEVKNLKELCEKKGDENVNISIAPLDNNSHILIFITSNQRYVLRVKAKQEAREFKFIATALKICRDAGFKQVNVVL